MKKIMFTMGALALIMSMLLCSCSGSITMKDNSGNGCVDTKNKINYKYASVCYEPVNIGKKHGVLKVGDKQQYEVYEIEGLDSSKWLATDENNVLYAEGVDLPSLAQMSPNLIRICTTEVSGLEISRLSYADAVANIVEAYESREGLTYPAISAKEVYKVRFMSNTYPQLCYTLTYLEYSQDIVSDGVNYGKYFLYSAFDEKFVPIGDELHLALEGAYEAEDETSSYEKDSSENVEGVL